MGATIWRFCGLAGSYLPDEVRTAIDGRNTALNKAQCYGSRNTAEGLAKGGHGDLVSELDQVPGYCVNALQWQNNFACIVRNVTRA
jgi:hypothetical protein